MNKFIKNILTIILIIIGIILFDSVQALIFDNNPIIGIQTRGMKKEGILVDTYHCGNGKHDTVIKGFSFSCSYKGGNYILVDNADVCASMKSEFYEDEKYIYYWDCIKGHDMLVKYDNGFEETIGEALKQGHIVIEDLDKFDIDYIKEEK